jgi:thiamine kinase-like enzyme
MINLSEVMKNAIMTTFGRLPDELEALTAGFSGNSVIKIGYGDQWYVCRDFNYKLMVPESLYEVSDAIENCEMTVLFYLAEKGIGPAVRYPKIADSTVPVMITDCLEGRALTIDDFEREEIQSLLFSAIRLLRQFPLNDSRVHEFGLVQRCSFYLNLLGQQHFGNELAGLLNEIKQQFLIFNTMVSDPSFGELDLCLCHNDLNPNNIFWQKEANRLFFIDNTDAGYADSMEEFAKIVNIMGYNDEEADAFVRAFDAEIDDVSLAKLPVYCQGYLLRNALATLLSQAETFKSVTSIPALASVKPFSEIPRDQRPSAKTDPVGLVLAYLAESKKLFTPDAR